jgi:hypothetical protein
MSLSRIVSYSYMSSENRYPLIIATHVAATMSCQIMWWDIFILRRYNVWVAAESKLLLMVSQVHIYLLNIKWWYILASLRVNGCNLSRASERAVQSFLETRIAFLQSLYIMTNSFIISSCLSLAQLLHICICTTIFASYIACFVGIIVLGDWAVFISIVTIITHSQLALVLVIGVFNSKQTINLDTIRWFSMANHRLRSFDFLDITSELFAWIIVQILNNRRIYVIMWISASWNYFRIW